jgi:VanZ family protein
MAVNLQAAPWLVTIVKKIPGRDLTAHFVLFGGLSLLLNLAFAQSRIRGRELGVPVLSGVLLVVIALEEYSQKMIPRRDFSIDDLLASIAGVVLFAAIAWAILLWNRRSATQAQPASNEPSG